MSIKCLLLLLWCLAPTWSYIRPPHCQKLNCKLRSSSTCNTGDVMWYRTPDGSCNNLRNVTFGKSAECMPRLLPSHYGDHWGRELRMSATKQLLPNTRHVSNELNVDPVDGPYDEVFSQIGSVYGEFSADDFLTTDGCIFKIVDLFALQPCCGHERNKHPDCAQIVIPPRDRVYGPQNFHCINFVRAAECTDCTDGRRQQRNLATNFVDMSPAYGQNEALMDFDRRFIGGQIRLTPDDLLFTANENDPALCGFRFGHNYARSTQGKCLRAQDPFINIYPSRGIFTTIYKRNHNRMALILRRLNPYWNDEQLFQEARRINAAIQQNILYSEYISIILGNQLMEIFNLKVKSRGFTQYNPDIDPRVFSEYAIVAYRAFGHSLVNRPLIQIYRNGSRKIGTIDDNQFLINDYDNWGIDSYMRGFMSFRSDRVDLGIDDSMRHNLYKVANHFGPDHGLDLAAIDIQRGRDVGIPPYVRYVELCLSRKVRSFDDLVDLIPPAVLQSLRNVFASVDDIDVFIGLLAENHLPGARVGPTMACMFVLQWYKLKFGDRFWFEHQCLPNSFTEGQMQEIRKTSLAWMFCRNLKTFGPDERLQRNVFAMPSIGNPMVMCRDLPDIDFSHWSPQSCGHGVACGPAEATNPVESDSQVLMNVRSVISSMLPNYI